MCHKGNCYLQFAADEYLVGRSGRAAAPVFPPNEKPLWRTRRVRKSLIVHNYIVDIRNANLCPIKQTSHSQRRWLSSALSCRSGVGVSKMRRWYSFSLLLSKTAIFPGGLVNGCRLSIAELFLCVDSNVTSPIHGH